MSAPSITSGQIFNFVFGQYSSFPIAYTGNPVTWTAVGLPLGISLDQNGNVYGTPTVVGNRSSYITATDINSNSSSSIIKFSVQNSISNISQLLVSPSNNGYANITPFQFTASLASSLSAQYILWNFGDGGISNQQNPSHIYKIPGQYIVTLNVYSTTQNVSLSSTINAGLILNESIYYSFVPPPAFAGHLNRYPFTLTFTSSVSGPHYIDLAAQFSRSYETQNPRNKWSFLRPEWRFLDLNGNTITEIIPSETTIYANQFGLITNQANGFFAGVTGTASFYFVDDIYNFDLALNNKSYTTLIATLRTNQIRSLHDSFNADYNLPSFSNSLATASCPYKVLWRNPDNIAIKENGIRDYINPRWPSAIQPIVAYTDYTIPYPDTWIDGNGASSFWNPYSYAFCHNIPVDSSNAIQLNLVSVGFSATFVPTPTQFQWIDNTGYKTPGYYRGTFTTNVSAANNVSLSANLTYSIPILSAQYVNPTLWISNPEAGMMAAAQYIYSPALSAAFDTPNLNIAQVYPFDMPIITQPDFTNDPMALSGFHGINAIASLPAPTYHAWALDSEMNSLYRINTMGQILCAIDINGVVAKNNLGFLVNNQVSPLGMTLDSKQNIWMTLYDSISTLKFDSYGNFLFATTPLSAKGNPYGYPPNINLSWYSQNTYFQYYFQHLTETISVGNSPNSVSVSPDGTKVYVANFNDSNVSIISTSSNTVTNTISVGAQPFSVTVSPDGTKVYVSNDGINSVGVINTSSNTVTNTTPLYSSSPRSIAVSPDGTKIYVAASGTNVVIVINTSSNTVITTIPLSDSPRSVAMSPDGTKVYAATAGYNSISVISTSSNTVTSTIPIGGGSYSAVVSPDGTKVYVADSLNGVISVVSTSSNTVTNTISVGAEPRSVAVSPDGTKVYVADFNDNTVRVISTSSNTVTDTISVGSSPKSVAVSPDGTKVYVANFNDNTVTVINNNNNIADTNNTLNNIDLNFVEPTGIDTDKNDNVWVSYSNYASGFLVKYNSNGGLLYTYAYPVCSCPQALITDTSNNVWIALSNNMYPSNPCYLEKRDTNGNKLSSFGPFMGLNKLTLDYNQNPWFTFSYSSVGSVEIKTSSIFTTDLSAIANSTPAANWFNPNLNTDETALEGIGCDINGNVFVINSIENRIYVLNSYTKTFVNRFYINPQGFTFYMDDQFQPTKMNVSLWNKSAQADGDWTGLNWYRKYANTIPQYITNNTNTTITGTSVLLDFVDFQQTDIFKINENFDLADNMHSLAFTEILTESEFLFKKFLGSIYGKYPFKHTDVGVTLYEKTANYVSNISDIDYCNVKEIYNLAEMMDIDLQNFNLNYPQEVQRIMNLASVNLSKLLGARSVEQSAFTKPNSQGKYNMNFTPINSLNYKVTAGIPLVLRNRSLDQYRLVNTGYINCSAMYTLDDFAKYLGFTDPNWPSYYEFHPFIQNYDGTQVAGLIDWNNPQTTINENVSSNNAWFGRGNYIDTQFSYELYNGLGLL